MFEVISLAQIRMKYVCSKCEGDLEKEFEYFSCSKCNVGYGRCVPSGCFIRYV